MEKRRNLYKDCAAFYSSLSGTIPLSVILYAIGLFTPSIILDSLQTNEDFNKIALSITAFLRNALLQSGAELYLSGEMAAEQRNAIIIVPCTARRYTYQIITL